jgi:hypothetical protein
MSKQKEKNVVAINTRNVPEATRSQFKAYCARRGYTMEAAIIALMRDCIDHDRALPAARAARNGK